MTPALSAFRYQVHPTPQTPELFAETAHGVGMMNLFRHEHPAIDLAKLVKSIPEADLYRYTRRRWL
jgi:hypothetical protein